MRLLPRSLFGRLTLILAAGLVVAQLLSAWINFVEREQVVFRAGGMRTAQRIADIVDLLEPLSPAERRRIVPVLDAPPLRVALLDAAPAADSVDATPRIEGHGALFETLLRSALGAERPLRVLRAEGRGPGRRMGMGQGQGAGMSPGMGRGPDGLPHRPGMGPGGSAGLMVVAQVGLRDGAWLRFDSTLPQESADLPRRLLLSLAVLLLAAIAVSLIAVRWVTRPLKLLAGAAEDLGCDIRRPPLAEKGPTEVRRAAQAFNTMQARLRRYLDERVRILTAVSHDLKTPITRMRLRTELLADEALRGRFEKDLAEMEAMVGATLEFMRGGGDEPVQAIDVDALLESVQGDAQEAGHVLGIDGHAAAPYAGRMQSLKRCVANLVDNALRYGERAAIVVEDAADRLTLRVLNSGPGIPEDELEKVFEPFYRLESSRSRGTGGTGLGLGIARNIAREHGGDLVLHNRLEGGVEAVLTLARKPGPAAVA
jgi:signal transduction histidine kinase